MRQNEKPRTKIKAVSKISPTIIPERLSREFLLERGKIPRVTEQLHPHYSGRIGRSGMLLKACGTTSFSFDVIVERGINIKKADSQ